MMMLMKKKKKMMMLMKKKKKMMMLKKKKKMTMMTILSETDWVRNDKWTVLMEAASFGQAEVIIINVFILIVILIIILIIINGHIYHVQVVSVLLERPGLELEAVNVRGQILVDYITLCSVQYSVYSVFSEYSVYSLYSVYPLYAVYILYFQNIR